MRSGGVGRLIEVGARWATLVGLSWLSSGCASGANVAPATPTTRSTWSTSGCGERGVAIQVLGSGGPIADDARASSAYVVWHEGRARVLVDAGGGTFVRFAESGAKLTDLKAILLTHLHVDHAAGLPTLLKSGYFEDGSGGEVLLAGPSGSDRFPATRHFVQRLIGADGAFSYLSGYLTGEGQPFKLRVRDVDVASNAPARLLDAGKLRITAVGVPHGIVPAVGYLVELTVDGAAVRIAFSGDQRMDDPRFAKVIDRADVLIAHHAVPERVRGPARSLHAVPSQIARLAHAANVKKLVLSHHMQRSLDRLDESRELIVDGFGAEPVVTQDMDCIPVDRRSDG